MKNLRKNASRMWTNENDYKLHETHKSVINDRTKNDHAINVWHAIINHVL